MRDSISASLLNLLPEYGDPIPDAFGGYDDGQWPDADAIAAAFPGFPVLRFTVNPKDNEGDVLDVERGDANPGDLPGWITRRRARGHTWPTGYCALSEYPACWNAVAAAHVTQPFYIVAAYPGSGNNVPPLPNVIGHQWADRGPYDETVLLPSYPLFGRTIPTPPVGNLKEITVNCLDPESTTGGAWIVDPSDGHIENLFGSPWLGGLNPNRFTWQQVGQIAGITPFRDGQGRWGYAIIVRHFTVQASGAWYSLYQFPRNGSDEVVIKEIAPPVATAA